MPHENSQHLNQAFFFNLNPELIEHSLDIAIEQLMQAKNLCKSNNTNLKVLILPSELETDDKIKNQLIKDGISKEIISTNQLIVDKFLFRLKNNKIDFYDLTQDFINSREDLYWDADAHLNVSGHKLVANKTKDFILN